MNKLIIVAAQAMLIASCTALGTALGQEVLNQASTGSRHYSTVDFHQLVSEMDSLKLVIASIQQAGVANCWSSSINYQGYDYALVAIGSQCWFAENLRTDAYANGDPIPGELSAGDWSSTTSGAQSVYGEGSSPCNLEPCDEVANLAEYGRLYNWYAVDDARGLCPSGWHVPSDMDFMTLEMELGMTSDQANLSANERGTDQAAQLKASDSDFPAWNSTNFSGFSALPGGARGFSGNFNNVGGNTDFWTSTQSSTGAWNRRMSSINPWVSRWPDSNLHYGFSVRCVRD